MSESKINLPRLKELDAKATKGPWDFESPSGEPANCLCMTDEDGEGITIILSDKRQFADVKLIEASRTELPRLVAWVERMVELLGRMKEETFNTNQVSGRSQREANELLAEIEGVK